MRRRLILVACLLAFPALSQTIPWIRLRTSLYSYHDSFESCRAGSGPGSVSLSAASVYFSGEWDEGKLRRGYFSRYPDWPASSETFLELLPEEVSQARLHQDSQGRYWLVHLKLSESRVSWVFDHLAPLIQCLVAPPRLKSVQPSPLAFDFELEAVREGVPVSYSEAVSFTGNSAGNRPYEARLQLKQERW